MQPRPRPIDLERRIWLKELKKREKTALADMQKTATAWGATLTALTSVFGIASLIKGRSDLNELAEPVRYIVFILAAAALGTAAFAIYKAALAAQGEPREILVSASNYHDLYLASVARAAGHLRASRVAGPIAVALLGLAITTLWLGPSEPKPTSASKYLVLRNDGQVLCGELTTSEAGVVSLQPLPPPKAKVASVGPSGPQATPAALPPIGLSGVLTMTQVSSCHR
jgi:hypothetical protein